MRNKVSQFLDLKKIFSNLSEMNYVIVKLPPEFPEYLIGSDIDIFCYNAQEVSGRILACLNDYLNHDIKIEVTDNEEQLYIDVIKNSEIHFRFDIYGSLPNYKNVRIKKAFFSSVIENYKLDNIFDFPIKTPSEIDESILRYIEYHEWYFERPDKIKHLEYLTLKIDAGVVSKKMMLDKLHYYTALPDVSYLNSVSSSSILRYFDYMLSIFKKTMLHFKNNGIKKTLIKISKRVFN